MAVNKEGTGYTIGFSTVMVVVVGAILAVAATVVWILSVDADWQTGLALLPLASVP